MHGGPSGSHFARHAAVAVIVGFGESARAMVMAARFAVGDAGFGIVEPIVVKSLVRVGIGGGGGVERDGLADFGVDRDRRGAGLTVHRRFADCDWRGRSRRWSSPCARRNRFGRLRASARRWLDRRCAGGRRCRSPCLVK